MPPEKGSLSLPALALMSLGVSCSFLLWIAAPVVNPVHTALYHWSGPTDRLFVPVIVDLLGMALLMMALIRSALRPGRWRHAVWGAIILFTPSIELKNFSLIEDFLPWHGFPVALAILALMAWMTLIFSWRTPHAWRLEPPIAAAQTLFLFMGIGGMVLIAEVGYFAWQARAIDRAATSSVPRDASTLQLPKMPNGPRIIWIVFDELSFQQVYASRFPGLKLPAFDALAASSTVFTNAVPAGDHTELVMPSLFSGKRLDQVRSTATGQLRVQGPDDQHSSAFNPYDTIFNDARGQGYQSAVAGWYNPYCRMLAPLLSSCFWTYDERIQTGMYPGASIVRNSFEPFEYAAGFGLPQRLLSRFLPIPSVSVLDSRQHLQDFRELDQAAASALDDPSANFVLLHLPVPHPGSIFNRATSRVTASERSYIDNLALTDLCLASLRAHLERSGQWDASTIVIMGDHSWRTWIWRNLPGWTAEDERASHNGVFDPRPFYLVKLAAQHTPATINTPFNAINTRAMMDQFFSGQIRTPQQLAAWATHER